MFSANGVRPAQNNYLLDGIDNNTSNVDFLSGVAYIVKPPVDAVDEIKILTSSFSAEYGRAGGAVLNTTLKSGTNALRGSVWEFDRNDALNATDFFANRAGLKKGKYLSNQFGLTAGGPIVSGKTFFFADYEGSLIKQARTWVTTVPTAAQRSSGFTDFSDLIACRAATSAPTSSAAPSSAARSSIRRPPASSRSARSIRSPGMAATRAGFVRDAFPGNHIPASRLNADALRLMKLYPEPNQPGLNNNYVVNRHQQRRHALVRHAASTTTSAPTIASSPATASRTTTRCGRRRSTATPTAAGSTKATRRSACTGSRPATRTCSRRR